MENDFKINDLVFYYNGNSKKYTYEIMSLKGGFKIENSNFIFGYDIEGNPMRSYYGRFDFVLAEYDKIQNNKFVKNIPCLIEEVSKNGIFAIDKGEPTKI